MTGRKPDGHDDSGRRRPGVAGGGVPVARVAGRIVRAGWLALAGALALVPATVVAAPVAATSSDAGAAGGAGCTGDAPAAADDLLPVGLSGLLPRLQHWSDDGAPQGLDVDVLRRVAQAAGLRAVFVRCASPQALLLAWRSGRVRVVAISGTPPMGGAASLAVSRPYAWLPQAVLARSDTTSVPAAADAAGRRVALLSGQPASGPMSAVLSSPGPWPWLPPRVVPGPGPAASAVASGTLDLVMGPRALLAPVLGPGLRLLDSPALAPEPRRLVALDRDAALMARLDQALGELGADGLAALQARWVDTPDTPASSAASSPSPSLPAAEVLPELALRVGYPRQGWPFTVRTGAGIPTGPGVLLMNAVARRAGLSISEWVPLEPHEGELAIAAGRIDVMMGVSETASRRDRLTLVGPYHVAPLAIVTRSAHGLIAPSTLVGRRVGLPRGLANAPGLPAMQPAVRWVAVDSEPEALDGLMREQLDAVLAPLHGLEARFAAGGFAGLRATGVWPGLLDDEHLAVSRARPGLALRLRDGLDAALVQDWPAIERDWSDPNPSGDVDWARLRRSVAWASLALALLLAGWAVFRAGAAQQRRHTVLAQRQAAGLLQFLTHDVRNTLQPMAAALAPWRHRPVRPAASAAGPALPQDEALAAALGRQTARTIDRLDELVDEHRLHAGTLTLLPRPEPVHELVAEVVAEMNAAPPAPGQSVQLLPRASASGWWRVDALRLRQLLRLVLQHLLADGRPGRLVVDLSSQTSPRGPGWGHWVLAVGDPRPPAPPGTAPPPPAPPLPAATTSPGEPPDDPLAPPGTPPRLRVARRLVKALGGTLVNEAPRGSGQGLIVRLDLAAAPEAGGPAPSPLARVLVADDTPASALLLEEALVAAGIAVQRAASVADVDAALAAADRAGPEALPGLLLCDSQLADGGLAELMALLAARRARGLAAPPVVGMASVFDPAEAARYAELGVLDLMVKDADLPRLVRHLQRLGGAGQVGA